MKIDALSLPNFSNPPIHEVVLSARFEPIAALQGPFLGMAWSLFRAEYPRAEQHPPVEPTEDVPNGDFPAPQIQIQVVSGVPTPRYWFLNEDRTRIVQLQPDRFTVNWRKVTGAETYPRFDEVSKSFSECFDRFCTWVQGQDIGEVRPLQCELTYVNRIEAGGVWKSHGEAHKVFTILCNPSSTAFLPPARLFEARVQYGIPDDVGQPAGRLHVGIQPILRATDRKAAYRMELTARGAPEGDGADGVMRFFRRGHVWVVLGFVDLTTPNMHAEWERKDDDTPRDR